MTHLVKHYDTYAPIYNIPNLMTNAAKHRAVRREGSRGGLTKSKWAPRQGKNYFFQKMFLIMGINDLRWSEDHSTIYK